MTKRATKPRPTRVSKPEVPLTGAFIRGVGSKTVAEMLKEAVRFCEKKERAKR